MSWALLAPACAAGLRQFLYRELTRMDANAYKLTIKTKS